MVVWGVEVELVVQWLMLALRSKGTKRFVSPDFCFALGPPGFNCSTGMNWFFSKAFCPFLGCLTGPQKLELLLFFFTVSRFPNKCHPNTRFQANQPISVLVSLKLTDNTRAKGLKPILVLESSSPCRIYLPDYQNSFSLSSRFASGFFCDPSVERERERRQRKEISSLLRDLMMTQKGANQGITGGKGLNYNIFCNESSLQSSLVGLVANHFWGEHTRDFSD